MRTVLAMLLAVVLGVGGGVATGLATGAGPRVAATVLDGDPLDLGITRLDPGCTGDVIRIVAVGDTDTSLSTAVIDNAGYPLHYLRVDDSCRTIYVSEDEPVPDYVAYAGPYPYADAGEPCAVRLSDGHGNDYLTRLREDNDTFVKCVCKVDLTVAPVLDPEVEESVLEGNNIWLRALQGMLVDAGKLPGDHRNGRFDEETRAAVELIQQRNAIPQSGVVGFKTWRAVRINICPIYDY